MLNMKYEMSIRLIFCRSAPPEFLQSFLLLFGIETWQLCLMTVTLYNAGRCLLRYCHGSSGTEITSSKHGIAAKYSIIGFYHSFLEEVRGIGGAPPNEMGI